MPLQRLCPMPLPRVASLLPYSPLRPPAKAMRERTLVVLAQDEADTSCRECQLIEAMLRVAAQLNVTVRRRRSRRAKIGHSHRRAAGWRSGVGS